LFFSYYSITIKYLNMKRRKNYILQNNFLTALRDEYNAIVEKGGEEYYFFHICRIETEGDSLLFQLQCEEELFCPDDVPAKLLIDNQKYDCIVLSTEGSNIYIATNEHIKEIPGKIILDLSFLVKALIEKIEDIFSNDSYDLRLASKVFRTGVLTPYYVKEEKIKSILKFSQPDESQLKALSLIAGTEVSFIWGPPGTGKTETIAAIVEYFMHFGDSVLVTSHSNIAIDMAIQKICKNLSHTQEFKENKILRIGNPRIINEKYRDYVDPTFAVARLHEPLYNALHYLTKAIESLKEKKKLLYDKASEGNLLKEDKDAAISKIDQELASHNLNLRKLKNNLNEFEKQLVREALIISSTLSKLLLDENLYAKKYDIVIIDEASAVWLPHIFFASALAGKKVIILGDFKQLAPISIAQTKATKEWLMRDIFVATLKDMIITRGKISGNIEVLRHQYRMIPAISKIVNDIIYNKTLIDSPTVLNANPSNIQPMPECPVLLIDISNCNFFCLRKPESKSHYNIMSALLATLIAINTGNENKNSIAIITPYAFHARLIRKIIRDLDYHMHIKAATIHKFQGSEEDYIIFDYTDTYPLSNAGFLLRGGANSAGMRLINVAITRARHKLCIIADYSYLQKRLYRTEISRQVLDYVAYNHMLIKASDLLASKMEIRPHERIQFIMNPEMFERDLFNAQESIHACIKEPHDLSLFERMPLSMHKKLTLFIESKAAAIMDKYPSLKKKCKYLYYLPANLFIFDQNIMWIRSMPMLQNDKNINEILQCRALLPETSKLLLKIIYDESNECAKKRQRKVQQEQYQEIFSDLAHHINKKCESCNEVMIIKYSYQNCGIFFSCPDYGKTNHPAQNIPKDEINQYLKDSGLQCPNCKNPLMYKWSWKTRKHFLGCSNYPECKTILPTKSLIESINNEEPQQKDASSVQKDKILEE